MNKVKRITLLILCAVLLISGVTVALSNIASLIFADGEGSFVDYKNQLNMVRVDAYKYNVNDKETSIAQVENNGFVMLENGGTNLLQSKQGVRFLIMGANSDVYLPALDVNIYLNGKQLSHGGALRTVEGIGTNGKVNNSLAFDIDPNTTLYYFNEYDSSQQPVPVQSLQGLYEFYFKLRIDYNNNVSNYYPQDKNWYKYSFVVLDQSNYGVDSEDDNQFPRILNVEDSPAVSNADFFRQNIFNYNEFTAVGGDTNATYPALRFDPENYNIQIKRTYNNVASYISTRFAYTTETYESTSEKTDYGILYFDYEDKSVGFKLERTLGKFFFQEDFNVNSSNAVNYNLPLFYELGKYELEYNYQIYLNGEFKYETSENGSISIGKESLIVFGYTPKFAQNLVEEDYLVSLKDGLESDITYKIAQTIDSSADISNMESAIQAYQIPSLDDFVSTNQSPVWINSYSYVSDAGTITPYYYHSKTGVEFTDKTISQLSIENVLDKKSYTKNTYFTDAGFYIVVLKYSFEEFLNQDYYQVFAFRITNTTPKVELVTFVDDVITGVPASIRTAMPSSGFTKNDVYVELQKPNTFDSVITATYSFSENFTGRYTEYQPFNVKYFDEENDYKVFNKAGKYFVRVYFNKSSYSTYSFSIDKDELSNQVSTYSVGTYMGTNFYSLKENLNNAKVINKPFTVIVKNKPSNAPISINLTTYDVVYQKNTNQIELLRTIQGKSYVYVDYIATNASSKQVYENIVAMDSISNIVKSDFVFNRQKIYIFEITDASGYRYVQSVFLDNTNSKVLQFGEENNLVTVEDFNIVSEKTNMAWGANKALKFASSSTENDLKAMELLRESSPMYETLSNGFSLLIPFTGVKINSFDLSATPTGDNYSSYNNKEDFTIYPNLASYSDVDSLVKGEKQYKITITDLSGNETVYNIEINMDKSLGKMFTTNTPEIEGNVSYKSTDNKLNLEQAGSQDALVFEWKDAEDGAFKIESITYDFYALSFDKTQHNYPYNDNPTETNVDILTDAKENNEYSYSNIINPELVTINSYDAYGNYEPKTKMVTKAGKYIITRKYVGGLENLVTESGDTRIKQYIYYADNKPVVDVPDFNNPLSYYVGKDIEILFGKENIPFKEFYREALDQFSASTPQGLENVTSNVNLILKSNLLPIKIKVPKNKYYNKDISSLLNNNLPNTFNLVAVLTRYDSQGNFISKKEYKAINDDGVSLLDPAGYLAINDIVQEGNYKLEIRDGACYPNQQLSPSNTNTNYIAFQVLFEQPNAEIIIGKTMYDESARTPMILSTNGNNKYIYDFSQSVVDTSTLEVWKRTKVANGMFGEYELWDSNNNEFIYRASDSSLELLAYKVNNNQLYTYQYKVTAKFIGNENTFTQFTPLVSDFDKFSTLNTNQSSTKSNYAIFTFEDPQDQYYAKIDTSDIQIKRYEKLANGSYSNYVILVKDRDYSIEERLLEDGRAKFSVMFYAVDENNPTKEYKFEIAYHYLGEEQYYRFVDESGKSVNYYSNSTVLIVDKTPPEFNLNNVAKQTANQKILQDNQMTSAFEKSYYKSEDGVYHFANSGLIDFAIDKNFMFSQPIVGGEVYNQAHEGAIIYYRKYNKYLKNQYMTQYTTNEEARAYQCLVPGMPEYYLGNSSKLRFNPMLDSNLYENWTEFGYGNMSFYDILVERNRTDSSTVIDGYYEIVEIDEAGNYTVYTVLLNTSSPIIKANISNIAGAEEKIIDNTTSEVNSLNAFEIVSIGGLECWYTIKINNEAFIVDPSTDMSLLINTLNDLFVVNSVNTLELSNRFGNSITVQISVSTVDKRVEIESLTNSPDKDDYYTVIIGNDEDGVMLKKLLVYIYDQEDGYVLHDMDNDGICEDSDGTPIIVDAKEPNATREYKFYEGIYQFKFEDNFRTGNDAYTINLNIGKKGNYEFNYEHEPIYKNNKRYTYGSVTLSAPEELFKVTATRNGTPITVNTPIHIFRPDPATNDIDVMSGANTEYVVSIYNITTGETETFSFTIYNIFPGVQAVDDQDVNMNSILSVSKNQVSTFTTKRIKLTWNYANLEFGYNVKLLRYEDGGDVPSNEITISGTSVNVTQKGVYELRFTSNLLGNSRSIYFMIKESTISMYEVYQRLPSGLLSAVLPADEMLDISAYETQIIEYLNGEHGQTYPLINGRLLVKNYFSIYNFQVEVEGDKNLKTNYGDLEHSIMYEYVGTLEELSGKFVTDIIVVYGVSPYSYLDIFAITKIQSKSKFLEDFGYKFNTTISVEETDDEGNVTTNIQNEERDVKIDAGFYDNIAVYESPITVYFQSYYGVPQNKIYVKYYFNGKLIGITYGNEIDELTSSIMLNTAGEYKLEFYDLAGNRQMFGNSNSPEFILVLKNQVVYSINGDLPIYGAVYNDNVVLKIQDITSYTTIDLVAYKNGEKYPIKHKNYEYIFSEQGLYKVVINGSVKEGNGRKQLQTSTLIFNIINKNEARFAYEFSNINGYEISKVIKNNIDITQSIKGENSGIHSLLLSATSFGVGEYHIFVKGNQLNTLNAMQEFDYFIWINDEIPAIQCSIGVNETTTNTIVLTFNAKSIFEQVGNCKIVVGATTFDINEVSSKNEIYNISINVAGTYFVTLQTEAGNVVSMFKVIKKDPLNTVSILLIVFGSIALIVGGFVFYRLRINMKVK